MGSAVGTVRTGVRLLALKFILCVVCAACVHVFWHRRMFQEAACIGIYLPVRLYFFSITHHMYVSLLSHKRSSTKQSLAKRRKAKHL